MSFFYYDGDQFEICETEEEARQGAENAIEDWRCAADPDWGSEVEHVCWGKIIQETVEETDGYYSTYKLVGESSNTEISKLRDLKIKKRSCFDKSRYLEIKELRYWRDRVFSCFDPDEKHDLIVNFHEVEKTVYDGGWTSDCTVKLASGKYFRANGILKGKIMDEITGKIYRHLISTKKQKTNERRKPT